MKHLRIINLFIKIVLYMPFIVLGLILNTIIIYINKFISFFLFRIVCDIKNTAKGTILEDYYNYVFEKYNEKD